MMNILEDLTILEKMYNVLFNMIDMISIPYFDLPKSTTYTDHPVPTSAISLLFLLEGSMSDHFGFRRCTCQDLR